MDAKELLALLPGIAYEAVAEEGRQFVLTHFRYSNGDLVNLYVEENANRLFLTDLGATNYMLSVDGIDVIHEFNTEIMNRMATAHGIVLEGGELEIETTPETAAKDALDLLQAISYVSTLIYFGKRRD